MKEERKPKMGKKEERITEQNTTSGFLLKKCNGWGGGGASFFLRFQATVLLQNKTCFVIGFKCY